MYRTNLNSLETDCNKSINFLSQASPVMASGEMSGAMSGELVAARQMASQEASEIRVPSSQASGVSDRISTRSPVKLPFYARRWLDALRFIEYGSLRVKTPEGLVVFFQGHSSGPDAEIELKTWAALKQFLLNGDVGLALSYQRFEWESPCLKNLFVLALKNESLFDDWTKGSFFSRILNRVRYFFQRNTLKGSKRNIQAHYDLSNAFYQLWLDPSMTYSAGIFSNDQVSLSQSQEAKYDRILSLLNTREGQLLEVGCGWGGFADRAVQTTEFEVTGLTLSQEQLSYAKARGLDRAQFHLRDYRHQNGQFDAIVSIEMFEAVGEAYWPAYFRQIKSLLKADGRAVIQTITIDDARFEEYRSGADSIRSFIFPGGMLPSREKFKEAAHSQGLTVLACDDFGQDYAQTIAIWLDQFDAQISKIKALGFDEPFIQLWRYYLCYCYAGFKTGRIGLMQAVLTHA